MGEGDWIPAQGLKNLRGWEEGWTEKRKIRILGQKLLLNESSHRTNKTSLITLSFLSVAREANIGAREKHQQLLVASVGGEGFQATERAVNAVTGAPVFLSQVGRTSKLTLEKHTQWRKKNMVSSPCVFVLEIFFFLKKQIHCFPVFHEKSLNTLIFTVVKSLEWDLKGCRQDLSFDPL